MWLVKLVRWDKLSGIYKVQHAHSSLMSSLVQGAIKYAHFELHAAIANADNFTE